MQEGARKLLHLMAGVHFESLELMMHFNYYRDEESGRVLSFES